MPTELTDLELFEVSLVDKGDDPNALVTLFKRKPDGENMNDEEIQALNEKAEKLQADVDAQKVENEKLRKFLIDEGYAIHADRVEKKAPEEMIEIEGEQIAKSAIPAPLLKKLQDMEKAAETVRLEKRGKEVLPNMRGTDLQKGLLLKAVDATADSATLLEILRAADAMFATMTEEVGKEGNKGDMLSPNEKLTNLVKAHQETHKVDYHKAYAAVAKSAEGKALVQAIYQEKGE